MDGTNEQISRAPIMLVFSSFWILRRYENLVETRLLNKIKDRTYVRAGPGRNVLSIQLKGRLSFRALIGWFSRRELFPVQNCSFGKTRLCRVGMIDIRHPRDKSSLIEAEWKLEEQANSFQTLNFENKVLFRHASFFLIFVRYMFKS